MLHNLMLARAFYGPKTKQNPLANIYDAGDHYLLQLEAVGFEKEEISLQLTGNSLHIEATKDQPLPDGYTLKYGNSGQKQSINRRFRFHDTLDTDNIEATIDNGLLNVKLPKRAAQRIPITVQ